MTAIRTATLSRESFVHGPARRNSEFNWGLTFAVALFLAVAIAELSIIVLAAPRLAEIGSLYATTT
jgi:hypothetical protein